jgi:hypothetical protein
VFGTAGSWRANTGAAARIARKGISFIAVSAARRFSRASS